MPTFVVSRPLADTPGYCDRFYYLTVPGGDCWGRCQITQHRKNKKKDGSWTKGAKLSDVYFIEPCREGTLPRGFRRFTFVKLNHVPTKESPGFYNVDVHADGRLLFCGCKGAVTAYQERPDRDEPCKHRDVIADLLAIKVFDAKDLAELAEVGTLY